MKKTFLFTLTVITCAFILSACNSEPSDTPNGGGPAISRTPLGLRVSLGVNLVQKFDNEAADPKLGGWYERADMPDSAKTYLTQNDYSEWDPKNAFLVYKYYGGEIDDEIASVDDFTVVVLEEGEDDVLTPKADTKLHDIGPTKVQIAYKGDSIIPVFYYDSEGKPRPTDQKYLEVMVAAASAPNGGTFAGFTIQKNPIKTEYDWMEPFEVGGLEVIKWYGNSKTLPDGTPVIAGPADYTVNAAEYLSEFAPNPVTGKAPDAPLSSSRTFTVKIQTPSGDPAVPPTADPNKDAEFTISRIPKQYTVEALGSNGESLSGGGINTVGATNKFSAGTPVTLKFQKGTNMQLNPESVLIQSRGTEFRPVAYTAESSNQLQFRWSDSSYDAATNALDLTKDSLTATFIMPAANVTVVGDFVFASLNLSLLELQREGDDVQGYKPIYGFSPHIKRYEYAVLSTQNWVKLRVTTGAAVDFIMGDAASPETTITEKNTTAKTCKIAGLAGGDTTVMITASQEDNQNITYLVIKKFNASKQITYQYTGGVQSFVPPVAGKYTFTAWGAYGGNTPNCGSGSTRGGIGGKSQGTLQMDPAGTPWNPNQPAEIALTNVLYVYVGEGGYAREGYVAGKATYNGGGMGGQGGAIGAGSSGGGATSLSLTRGAWADWQVLIDRIMVAGGGGGFSHNKGEAGSAGGLIAQGGCMTSWDNNENLTDYNPLTGYGPTVQYNGWFTGASQYVGSGRGGQGFGIGGLGPSPPGWGGSGAEGRGGGGGGYFGGEISWGKTGGASNCGGGGGSGYVSGMPGCIAYSSISSPTWLVQIGKTGPGPNEQWGSDDLDAAVATHYSGRVFTDWFMTNFEDKLFTRDPVLNPQEHSPVPSPFSGAGPLGARNRNGILIIEFDPAKQ